MYVLIAWKRLTFPRFTFHKWLAEQYLLFASRIVQLQIQSFLHLMLSKIPVEVSLCRNYLKVTLGISFFFFFAIGTTYPTSAEQYRYRLYL